MPTLRHTYDSQNLVTCFCSRKTHNTQFNKKPQAQTCTHTPTFGHTDRKYVAMPMFMSDNLLGSSTLRRQKKWRLRQHVGLQSRKIERRQRAVDGENRSCTSTGRNFSVICSGSLGRQYPSPPARPCSLPSAAEAPLLACRHQIVTWLQNVLPHWHGSQHPLGGLTNL